MECPVCGERLRGIERSGVEIDICPGCKGMWLDRGKLDEIVKAEGTAQVAGSPDDQRDRRDRDRRDDRGERDGSRENSQKGRRGGGLLGNLLDSFGGGD
jgi:uncharacterized protein